MRARGLWGATCLIWLALAGGAAQAQVTIYSADFENPPFAPGTELVGGYGWTGVAPPAGTQPPPPNLNPELALIVGEAPATGAQSVRVRGIELRNEPLVAPYAAVGSYRRALNYDTTASDLKVVTVQADVRLDGPVRAAGDDFASATVAAISGDGTAGEIGISSDGMVYGYAPDSDPGAAPAVRAPVSLGQYHLLGVRVDFRGNTVQYLVDGSPLGAPLTMPAAFTSDVLARASLVAYARPEGGGAFHSDYIYRFDNFAVTAVPEPATAGLLTAALSMLLKRRRAK